MQTETAEHFAKKEWNEKKQKFDYIYPSDMEKERTRLAVKTMKSSTEDRIPEALRLAGPIERTMDTKEKREIKRGAKVEHEHHDTIKKIQDKDVPTHVAEKMIAKDHVEEDKNYYPKLKKMESQQDPLFVSNLSDRAKKSFEAATTDCAPIRTMETAVKVTPNKGDRFVNLSGVSPRSETADDSPKSDPTRSWKWKEHSYAARTGTKGHYKYDYGGSKSTSEAPDVEKQVQQDKSKQFVPGGQSKPQEPAQREENPSQVKDRSPQEKANLAKAPGQKMPPMGGGNKSPMQNVFAAPKPMQIGGQMPNQKMNAQAFTNRQVPPTPTGVNAGDARNGAMPTGQNLGNMPPSNTAFQNPLGQFMSNTSAPGNTMPEQAKNMGHVFDSRQVGNEDYEKQDDPLENPLHPSKIQQDPKMAERYGDCHRMAKAQADRYGGVKYTTSGRAANFHSMTINPDQTVFDYVLGINGMPLDKYLSIVPYTFIPN